ncbi:MAG: ribosome small subunit-dependent GTPase A [Caldilineaceae bacterium]|nr:ribosome small subunit-dependent GTPase A [Caldilineaceae bacterium]
MASRRKVNRLAEVEQDLMQFEDRYKNRPRPKRDSSDLVAGIVVRARGHHYDVRIGKTGETESDGQLRVCEVRGRLLAEQIAERSKDTLVAVGDHVWVRPNGKEKGLIERIDERTRVLSRQRPGVNVLAEDVILANPDQALVVFAAADPEPHTRMLDRFLVIAEFNELPTVICVNKVDLTGHETAKAIFGLYEEIGYAVIYASAVLGEGIDALRELLTDRVTVVTGPSGVGKSSLINCIDPRLDLQVGDLRDFQQKGKHTTRAAQLIPLPFGDNTYIADTPGIRELGLYDIDPIDLQFYFVEMQDYLHDCRYSGCTHDHEPGCAVRAAVEAGKINAERYESYLRLLHGEE